jgi:hypothetical protein
MVAPSETVKISLPAFRDANGQKVRTFSLAIDEGSCECTQRTLLYSRLIDIIHCSQQFDRIAARLLSIPDITPGPCFLNRWARIGFSMSRSQCEQSETSLSVGTDDCPRIHDMDVRRVVSYIDLMAIRRRKIL